MTVTEPKKRKLCAANDQLIVRELPPASSERLELARGVVVSGGAETIAEPQGLAGVTVLYRGESGFDACIAGETFHILHFSDVIALYLE